MNTDKIKVLLYQTVTKDSKGESEEDHGAECIQDIEFWQKYKIQFS